MRCPSRGMLLTCALLTLPALAAAEPAAPATPAGTAIYVEAPRFPTPYQSAVVGLALTAVVVVGARATQRTSGTMMYMVLGTVALTGIFIAASQRVHSNFDEHAQQVLSHMQRVSR